MRVRDRRWVTSAGDGTAASLHTTCPESSGLVIDPLAGSAGATPLPSFSSDDATKWWADHAIGTVSGDGTIVLCGIGPVYRKFYMPSFNVALLHPGDTKWILVHEDLGISSGDGDRCCVAYHDGKIVLSQDRWSWCIARRKGHSGDHRSWWMPMSYESGRLFESSYVLESHGELLLAIVRVLHQDYHDVGSLVTGLSVSVYALEEAAAGGGHDKPRWVKRDGRSFADRVLFLGLPSSFAVDAARFGMSRGCAYFVLKKQLYGGIWSKSALDRCRLFKYSFHDDKSELVEQLPEEWNNEACMWLTPQPAIATTEEIRERLEALNKKVTEPQQQLGAYFRIYVGNLPRKVDSYRLRQFFSKHGKVADARVMCDRTTRRSRGFGFVTMATAVDDEPPHVIAKLHGQSLDGRPLQVKFADQERRSTAGC